jgi:hypothetical protein
MNRREAMKMDEELRRSMAVQADGPVDVGSLLSGSTSQGRTLRRRHRVAVAVAVTAVLGVGIGVPVAVWPTSTPRGGVAGPPAGFEEQGPDVIPMPPSAPGRPTVLEDPAVLGSDPTLLHLSFAGLPPGSAADGTEPPTDGSALTTRWGSMAGSEYLSLGSPMAVDFFVGPLALEQKQGRTRQGATTVNGKPAETYVAAGQQLVLWQPVTGVWAAARAVNDTTGDELLAAASKLRFDRVGFCAVRFSPAAAPPRAALSRCDMALTEQGLVSGGRLVYGRADGSILEIRDNGTLPSGETPNATVAGRPAHWGTGDLQGVKGDLLSVDSPGDRNVVLLVTGSFTRAEAETFLSGLTWP